MERSINHEQLYFPLFVFMVLGFSNTLSAAEFLDTRLTKNPCCELKVGRHICFISFSFFRAYVKGLKF